CAKGYGYDVDWYFDVW
nr:immunoglobulin heavy chain junction region [Mus musculus]MBK4188351.1 immunoglobulin heavy chain junction region [Mus musculus]MBK4188352.1 immunoglobulin heavy chain junction region [Mus musculus]MBK4188353.1 immunoglobulin heavy chain junction region [Mus musculus]MBK4189312.1 immunoglobulin heavy chain junction region [Mus musculus]